MCDLLPARLRWAVVALMDWPSLIYKPVVGGDDQVVCVVPGEPSDQLLQIAKCVFRRFEDLLPALRPLLNHTSAPMRRNTIEILAEACRTRLTYLYIHALNDADDHVAATARDALAMVTSDYHLDASAARRGAIQIARDELASHKYSILDPLSTALSQLGQLLVDDGS